MFSSRFHWDLEPNRLTRALRAKQQAGVPILDLTESNPTRAGLNYPPEILEAFRDTRNLRYDPAPAGALDARQAVGAYYAARGVAIDPDQILLTASTSEAYSYLFKLLTDPGGQVLVPRPSYPLFEFLASMESVVVRSYPLVYHGGWSMDLEALESALTDRTRAVVLVNPNNPTGSFVKREELARLVCLTSQRPVALISDEVFSDYAYAPDPHRVSTLATLGEGLAFSLGGLSKGAGLPQMKLGWIVAAGAPDLRRQALERLEWIADTYLSVSTPVQSASARLLAVGQTVQTQIRQRTIENLGFARQSVAGTETGLVDVEGGWYVTLRVPRVRTEEEWTLELLDRYHILVQPGYFFDFESEAYLVLSLLTPPEVFQEGVGRLLKCIAADRG